MTSLLKASLMIVCEQAAKLTSKETPNTNHDQADDDDDDDDMDALLMN